jgi:lactoylglutathione lyase
MPGRWTHIALPVADLDASIAWYTTFTPLEVLDRRADDAGESAWLGERARRDDPFVLVLVSFLAAQGPRPTLAPFAHIGIELASRDEVDAVARRAAAAGCLVWEPQQLPAPVGYVCAATDPDGNVVEFSFDQGVAAQARTVWADT